MNEAVLVNDALGHRVPRWLTNPDYHSIPLTGLGKGIMVDMGG